MPPRRQATVHATEFLLGGPVQWDGLTGTVRTQPVREESYAALLGVETLTDDVWNGIEDMVDDVWEHVIGRVDFSRVLLNALAEHLRRQLAEGEEAHPDHILVQEVCADCLAFALLTKEH